MVESGGWRVERGDGGEGGSGEGGGHGMSENT